MERFNYPSIAAVRAEDAEILQLLEAESYGDRGEQMRQWSALDEVNSAGTYG